MKKLSFILFVASLTFVSCNNEDSSTQEQEKAKLDRMYEEITQLSGITTQQCTDSNDWAFTSIPTTTVCGGNSYIVYSKKTNTKVFLDKVKAYTQSYADFNKKWNVVMLCDNMVVQPTGVKCVDGKPQLSYDIVLH